MDKNQQTANDILLRFNMSPVEHWELADAIKCALTDVEFDATFGSTNPEIVLSETQ